MTFTSHFAPRSVMAAFVICLMLPVPAATQEAAIATMIASTEGPTSDKEGNVYFTELVFGRIMKLSAAGVLTVFREHANSANGLLIDPQGRLIAAEGANNNRTGTLIRNRPQVTRMDLRTGKIEILADAYEGKPLSGPNDVTIDGKERLYFTDPGGPAVYRIDAPGKIVRILGAPDLQGANGIQVSPDDKTLYIAETGNARQLSAWDLLPDGTARNKRVVYKFFPGRGIDGMSIDSEGNIYGAAGLNAPRGSSETLDVKTGVYIISPAAKLLKFIPIAEDFITNTGFGGPDMKTLYITAGKRLYTIRTDIAGLPR